MTAAMVDPSPVARRPSMTTERYFVDASTTMAAACVRYPSTRGRIRHGPRRSPHAGGTSGIELIFSRVMRPRGSRESSTGPPTVPRLSTHKTERPSPGYAA
jgi:hypothetical protein